MFFKVETVGDCYVAVCGLPDPRRDHSLAMARFARDTIASMNVLTNDLVVSLGPDTGDLMVSITTTTYSFSLQCNCISLTPTSILLIASGRPAHWACDRRSIERRKGMHSSVDCQAIFFFFEHDEGLFVSLLCFKRLASNSLEIP